MADQKRAVWVADLEVKNVVAGLQKILDVFKQVTTAFGSELVVQLNTTQFNNLIETLEVGFKRMSTSIGNDIANSSLAIIANLEAIAPKAADVGQRVGVALGGGIADGAKSAMESVLKDIDRIEEAETLSATRLADRVAGIVATASYKASLLSADALKVQQRALAAAGIDLSSTKAALGTITKVDSESKSEPPKEFVSAVALAQIREAERLGAERQKQLDADAKADAKRLAEEDKARQTTFDNLKKLRAQELVDMRAANREKADAVDKEMADLRKVVAAKIEANVAQHEQNLAAQRATLVSPTALGPAYGPEAKAAAANEIANRTVREQAFDKAKAAIQSERDAVIEANAAKADAEDKFTRELAADIEKQITYRLKGYEAIRNGDIKAPSISRTPLGPAFGPEAKNAQAEALDLDGRLGPGFGLAAQAQQKIFLKERADGEKATNAAIKDQNTALKEQKEAHQQIGGSMLGSLGTALKIFLIYRALRDTIREVESGFSAFVQLGIAYTKQQEENQANLQGILSANFTVLNTQGQVLQGEERLNAIRDKAKGLAQDIATATKDTGIDAKDLVSAYELVTAPAVKYKLTTAEILDLTLKVVAAAKTAGVNAKEAGTQLDSILNGKGANDKLARMLQLSPNDIKSLQGTPALIDLITKRATLLGAANLAVGDSFDSVLLKFQKALGPISAKIEVPFFDAFKSFVATATAFLESQAGKELFANIGKAGGGITSALVSAGENIAGDGTKGLAGFIEGAGKAIELTIDLGGRVVQTLRILAQFLGTLSEIGDALGSGGKWTLGILAATALLFRLGQNFEKAAQGVGIMGAAIRAALPMYAAQTIAAEGAVTATTTAATAVGGLGLAATTLGTGVAIAAIGYFFYTVLENLGRVISQARLAKSAIANLSVADAGRGFDEAGTPQEKANFGYEMTTIVGRRGDNVRAMGADDSQATLSERKAAAQEGLDAVEQALPRMTSLLTELQAQATEAAAKATGTNAGTTERGLDNMAAALATAEKAKQDLAHVKGDIEKLKQERLQFIEVLKEAEKDAPTFKPAPVGSPTPPKEPSRFQDDSDARIRALRAETAARNSDDKVLLAKRLLNEDEYAAGVIEREQRLNENITVLLNDKLKRYKEFEARRLNSKDLKPGEADTKDADGHTIQGSLSKRREDIVAEQTTALASGKELANQAQIQQVNRARAFEEALAQYELNLQEVESSVTGQVADKAEAELRKKIERLKALVPTSYAGTVEQSRAVQRAEALIPAVRDDARDRAALKEQVAITADLTRQQNLLNSQLANGSLGTRQYAAETVRLRDAERGSLETQKAILVSEASRTTDFARLTEIRSNIDTLDAKLASIKTHAQDVQAAFFEWVGVFSSIGQSLHVFDVFGSQLGTVGDAFGKVINQAKSFFAIIQQGQSAMRAVMLAMASAGGGGGTQTSGGAFTTTQVGSVQPVDSNGQNAGLATLSSTILPLTTNFQVLTKSAGGLSGGFSGFLNKLGGGDGKSGGASTFIGAIGVAGMAAGVVVGIASAMFAAAVKRDTETMQKGLDVITAGIADSSVAMNDSMARLRAAQAADVAQYSGSKAGRKALDDIIPKFQTAEASLEKAAQSIIDAMEKTMQTSANGTGPEADFANTLLDLGAKSKAYLAALLTVTDSTGNLITKTSKEYTDGVAAMDKLYRETVQKELDSLTGQDQSNRQEDLDALQKVIDLTDKKKDLEKQVTDLQDAQRQEQEDEVTLAEDKAQAIKDQAKAREDQVKKVLDLEKQISDLELNTANTVADIKSRGVLEAQTTVAQQKARDISSVKSAEADQLAKLQDELDQAKDTSGLTKAEKDANKALDDRTRALEKQRASLADQAVKLQEQIALNNIDLGIAQTVAGVENQIFGYATDRLGIERDRGDIEIGQAKTKVGQWQQVQDLISSINMNGADLFVPPPGFPLIHVTIGDITIDNSSVSTGGTGGDTGGDKGGGDKGGGSRPPPTRADDGSDGRDNRYFDTHGGYAI